MQKAKTFQILFNKFRLAVLALPAVAAVLVLRYVLREVFDIGEVATFSEVGSVITGVTLILGFMLGGVLSDYKESEKLPASVAVALAGFHSTAYSGLLAKDLDVSLIDVRIQKAANAITGWFVGNNSEEEMWNSLTDLPALIVDLEKAGMATHYVGRLLLLNGELQATLNRVSVVRNTSFVQSGYVLMSILVLVLQGSLAIVSFPSSIMSWIAPSVLSLAYAYLWLLVRDLDNPFGHSENDGKGSGADVDITPLLSAVRALNSF
ncbi:MAG: hypothetical protein WCP50_03320 [Actinomycetota bacterium]|jgi:uncharacterized membrane protein YdcZ (DUF606 family)